MKNAIIIHGIPEEDEILDLKVSPLSESHWIPWVKGQLQNKGINAVSLEMPNPYDPSYLEWKRVFEKEKIDEDTILVGHSCGAGFLVQWLSENKVNVGEVILVAPWMDPEKEFNMKMFDFVIDPNLTNRVFKLTVMFSLDDQESIIKTVDELKAALPQATFKEFSDKGHFTLEDMGTSEFPELLEVLEL